MMMKQGKEIVLAYNLKNTEKGRKISLICVQMGIRLKPVEPAQFLQPLGALGGRKDVLPVQDVYEGPGFEDEMLVLCGFSMGRLNLFLDQFKRLKIRPVDLKAMLNDTNCTWDSMQLHEQISEEHAQLHGGQEN